MRLTAAWLRPLEIAFANRWDRALENTSATVTEQIFESLDARSLTIFEEKTIEPRRDSESLSRESIRGCRRESKRSLLPSAAVRPARAERTVQGTRGKPGWNGIYAQTRV